MKNRRVTTVMTWMIQKDEGEAATGDLEMKKMKQKNIFFVSLSQSYVPKKSAMECSTCTVAEEDEVLPDIVNKAPSLEMHNFQTLEQFFTAFTNDEILAETVIHINITIAKLRTKFKTPQSSQRTNLELVELKAFVGLRLYSAGRRDNHIPIIDLWSLNFGQGFCQAMMNEGRFNFIMRALRLARITHKFHDNFKLQSVMFSIFL